MGKLANLIPKGRMGTALIESALALGLFVWDPCNLSQQKDRYLDRNSAILSQYFYDSKGADKVAVVLIDQATLDDLDHDWPLTYGDLAGLAHRIGCAGARAVFLDIVPARKFNLADGAEDLAAAAMDAAGKEAGCPGAHPKDKVPVFLGVTPGIATPLLQTLESRNRLFLIETESEYNVYPVGAAQFPDHTPISNAETTPAFGMLRWLCGTGPGGKSRDSSWCPADISPAYGTKPVFLSWNGNTAPGQRQISNAANCADPPHDAWSKVRAGLEHFWFPESRRCPPVLTLRGSDLYRDADFIAQYGIDPASLLADRVVFVGVDLPAINDTIISPVHDRLPGVFSHAVAFDNLLSFGSDHFTVPTVKMKLAFAFLFYLVVNLTIEFFTPHIDEKIQEKEIRTKSGLVGIAERFIIFISVNKYTLLLLSSIAAILIFFVALSNVLRWPSSYIIMMAEYALGTDIFVKAAHQMWATRTESTATVEGRDGTI